MKEIVIKIPDAAYEACKRLSTPDREYDDILGICLINAIAEGTVLPESNNKSSGVKNG